MNKFTAVNRVIHSRRRSNFFRYGMMIELSHIDTEQENPSEIFISSVWKFIASHARHCVVLSFFECSAAFPLSKHIRNSWSINDDASPKPTQLNVSNMFVNHSLFLFLLPNTIEEWISAEYIFNRKCHWILSIKPDVWVRISPAKIAL